MVSARMRCAMRTERPAGVFARCRSSRIWPLRLAKTLSITSQQEPHAPEEAVVRLRVAVAGEAGEMASLTAAGIARDGELGAVSEPDAAEIEPARELLLHDRDQLNQATQPAVVLRLLGQMRKP